MSGRTLAEQVGELPKGIEALPDEHRHDLADAVRAARHRQAAELAKAGDESLRFVPAPLRPAIRKAMGL
jgi:hypothetical protein